MKYTKALFLVTVLFWSFSCFIHGQIPSGYYDNAAGFSGTALQSTLHAIIDNHNPRGYDQLWDDFMTTDARPDGKVWDIYSDTPGSNPPYLFTFISDQCGNYSQEGDCYNREHTFPQSWFNDATPMNTDLFQIIPTDGYVNGMRSNYPYGEVGSASWTSMNGSKLGNCSYAGYSGVVFEPIDDYKGDIARNFFYMATRYYNEDAGWPGSPMVNGSQPTEWAQSMLLDWHHNDPVDQKEIDRNNAVYGLQNNRNPYIDHPEYADLIWGEGYAAEPASHVSGFSAHTITLTWTDATGEIVPDGYLIRMNDTGFSSIGIPIDGTTIPDDFWNKNVVYGIQSCIFRQLTPNTVYYFKIYGFTGSSSNIDYKTDGSVQQVSIEAK